MKRFLAFSFREMLCLKYPKIVFGIFNSVALSGKKFVRNYHPSQIFCMYSRYMS